MDFGLKKDKKEFCFLELHCSSMSLFIKGLTHFLRPLKGLIIMKYIVKHLQSVGLGLKLQTRTSNKTHLLFGLRINNK